MPSSDYGNAVGGGLKLKGAKDAGVKKHKKKEKKAKQSVTEGTDKPPEEETALQKVLAEEEQEGDAGGDVVAKQRESETKDYGKTEAQRRHEERRRKRLDERLQREGIKTHKERVEELNKYLSNLSEHHDMPRIGPG
ncbi:hypothetical protein LTR36_001536 [Oleoguttula mirabilis]|uniref:DUF1754-domain-containing protein n=1 Tax=Oleoguttula mirabilis TaxID=1507867 RepID=A0AAV9JN49_9PEZI|nr:hypothetical protein LTR36_001536 [Oleoguttula mirabilis]